MRKVVWLVLLLLLVGCAEAAAPASEPTTDSPPEEPNVVFVIADDLNSALLTRHLSRYPNIRRLMDRGTTFENSFVTEAVCCPSRATSMTGQYTHNHGVEMAPWASEPAFQNIDDEALAVWMQDAGYRTGYFGRYLNHYVPDHTPPGWDTWGAKELVENPPKGYQVPGYDERGRDAEGRTHTEVFAERAAAFLQPQEGQPFFLYLAPYAPHTPPAYPEQYERLFVEARVPRGGSFNEADISDKPRVFRNSPSLTEAQIREYDETYRKMARSTKDVDRMLGRVTAALEEAGELDNTYIVFTSDNGYHWGQHRLAPGKWTAYEEDIRVPLVVAGPGVPQGQTRSEMVANTDLAPTIAAWTGAEPMREPDGRSLAPLLSSEDSPPWRTSLLVVGRPRFEAARRPGRLYVEYEYGDRELYNLRKDPAELENIAGRSEAAVMEANLAAILAELRSCAGNSCRAAEDGR